VVCVCVEDDIGIRVHPQLISDPPEQRSKEIRLLDAEQDEHGDCERQLWQHCPVQRSLDSPSPVKNFVCARHLHVSLCLSRSHTISSDEFERSTFAGFRGDGPLSTVFAKSRIFDGRMQRGTIDIGGRLRTLCPFASDSWGLARIHIELSRKPGVDFGRQ